MVKLLACITPILLAASTLQQHCDRCHQKMIPYQMIYKRALLLYSSKKRIEEALSSFLTAPSREKSILPPGLKMRFNPTKHPKFDPKTAKDAIQELIEREDILKKFR